jgi:adenine phosphoribosyltransferase
MSEVVYRAYIRDVPDFPEPGILFKDITPLLANHDVFSSSIAALADPFADVGITKVVGIEARGFIFAAPVANRLEAGFVPIRKAGKLPHEIEHIEYDLEYGTDRIEVHRDAITVDDRVLVVDDVLATGGTGLAAVDLIRGLGGEVVAFSVLVELGFLDGRNRLAGTSVHALVCYDGI